MCVSVCVCVSMCMYVCVCVYVCMSVCIYLVVYRASATHMWSCRRIDICLVFPSVDVHVLPLSPLPSVHSKYLYFFGENYGIILHLHHSGLENSELYFYIT